MAVSLTSGGLSDVVTVTSSAQSGSQNVAIPADTELVVVGISGWVNDASDWWVANPIALDSTNITTEQRTYTTSDGNVWIGYLASPTTGASVSFAWALGAAPDEGMTYMIIPLTGVDATTPIGDSGDNHSGDDVTGLTGVAAGDWIIGVTYRYNGNPTVTNDGQTELHSGTFNSAGAGMSYEDGDSDWYGGNHTYSTSAALIVNASAAGGTTLTVSDASHEHSLDAIVLSQVHNVSTADLSHSHTLDAATLAQRHFVSIADLAHSHTLDPVALSQRHIVLVDDLSHAHVLDAVDLAQRHNVTVADLSHAHALDGVALTAAGVTTLIIEDLLHAHALDTTSLAQVHDVSVADLEHGHTLNDLNLTGVITLSVSDMSHAQTLGSTALTQGHVLVVDDLGHSHDLGTVALSQVHELAVADLLHAHSLGSLNFALANGLVTLTFASKLPGVTWTSKKPAITWASKKPNIEWGN